MRVLELPAGASPRHWGQVHGESFRGEVRALCAIRTYLCTRVGGFTDAEAVRTAARAHLPVLERYSRGLYDELCGIADGAGVTPADVVIANHYTDLRDLSPDASRWTPAPGAADGGCSVVWADSPTGRLLAQTWDMHATAIPFVMMLKVPPSGALPGAWLLTLTGCLGLAGMNSARTAIAINNLYSTDATVGVVWPAVVRRALHERTAAAARDRILAAPIGSGHHYFVADRAEAYGIETSGVLRKVIFAHPSSSDPGGAAAPRLGQIGPHQYCHTNHCLDGDVAAVSAISPTSTTRERMDWLGRSLGERELRDLGDVWTRLGSQDGWPKSVCTNMSTPENPHGTATCGAIAMNLDTGELWAAPGFTTHVAAERFAVPAAPAAAPAPSPEHP
ncbi:MAG: hypothetical protein KBG28_16000 [Kofleriaceae bacterium]|nr:hypothetical protein [Kofleriaceae bacterium]MBP6837897.1 hypothetical protein [Kofleriaceae bacterium]MBP9205474.1 hypothetical protein [Kofleriaceae bacterium]